MMGLRFDNLGHMALTSLDPVRAALRMLGIPKRPWLGGLGCCDDDVESLAPDVEAAWLTAAWATAAWAAA